MRLEKLRILHRVTFDSCQGFRSIRNTGGVAEIDEAFVGEAFVKCFVDC